MTTPAMAALYLKSHEFQWNGRPYAVFNPHDKPVEELPIIYGFNNGGSADWWRAELIAQDGTYMGGHLCSSEGYMRHDLGILEGARPDRHEGFRKHYPDGYRMDFIPHDEVKAHQGLDAAVKLNAKQAAASK